jgi:release factor glutamine methyltransferase
MHRRNAFPTMTTIRTLLAQVAATLPGDTPRLDAELLLGHALRRSRAWLFAHADDDAGIVDATDAGRLFDERRAGTPIAYLIGEREFWSLPIAVTPATLIPRPETERLVELALARIDPAVDAAVADLGTGSGAIALAIASERPRARVIATDASDAALRVARGNAAALRLENVEFAHGHWCDALGGRIVDVIVSNPPYIAIDDEHLARGDLCHEPMSALASGVDGLDAIRTIIGGAPAHLPRGGSLLLEHGSGQAGEVRALLAAAGFGDVATYVDLEGRDRVSSGRK